MEDSPDDVLLITELLRKRGGFEIESVGCFADARPALSTGECDVVLLDLSLPDSQGLRTVLDAVEANPELAVVVLTGHDDVQLALRTVNSGAQDFLLKEGLDEVLLERTLRHAVERQRLVRQLKSAHARARHHATHDGLTGLANRQLYLDLLGRTLARARRRSSKFAVLFIDVDRFKIVNDLHGHLVGDDLLQKAAQLLLRTVRRSDEPARFAGDEFAITLPDIIREEDAARVAQSIVRGFETALTLESKRVGLTASVGIAVYPLDGTDEAMLLQNADTAMYAAKQSGGNCYRFYSGTVEADAARRRVIESELAQAVEDSQFLLHYQPQIDVLDTAPRGWEALVRWRHPRWGVMTPEHFVPIAEKTGWIAPLGRWVLGECCRQVNKWRDQGLHTPRIAVNVTPSELRQREFPRGVERALAGAKISAETLEIEITESGFESPNMYSAPVLRDLKELGVAIAIDDFGKGLSTFAALRRLPVDVLKMDRSFLAGDLRSEKDARIVEAILAMAAKLDLTVVAEGVETARQLDFLRERDCRFMQGYYFTRPLPAPELVRWLGGESGSRGLE